MTTFCLLTLFFFFFFNACLLLMFDSEKYNPSCTVNFETIRGDFQYVKEKKTVEAPYRLTLFILSHSICFYYSALFSYLGSTAKRNLLCGFAQQHLTISWNWHRLQCYRDSVVPDVQYRRAIHTEQSDEEERSPHLLFCLLMSIPEETFLAGPAPLSVPRLPLLIGV